MILLNMKSLRVVAAFAAVCFSIGCTDRSVGEGEYLIEGRIKNIPDSTVIELFKSDGRLMSVVARDTVIGGMFEFRDTVSEKPSQLGIYSLSKGFPNCILPVWVRAGETVTVTGEDNLLLTWRVKSRIKEQKDENDFMAVQFPEKKKSLIYQVEEADILKSMRPLRGEERRAVWRKVDSLRRLYEPLDSISDRKVLEYMRTAPVTAKWLDVLAMQSRMFKRGYGKVDSALIYDLYSRLSPADLETELGKIITASLNPPKTVSVGDAMADGDLYDAEGNVHHLSEFSGKYILLDFWSVGCGPCMESIPEGNEMARKHADRLAFVRLSLDGKETWTKTLKEKKSDCHEWNEFKAWGTGLSAAYKVNGIPQFVLISPEGKVIDIWSGYGQGSLRSKIASHLGERKWRLTD